MEATAKNGSQAPAWAIVELMGHVRLAGKLTEIELCGAKMGRLDIPMPARKDCSVCKGSGLTGVVDAPLQRCNEPDCNGFMTKYFGGSSVYCITAVSETVARQVSRQNNSAPVHAWDFPRPAALAAAHSSHDEDDDDADDDAQR